MDRLNFGDINYFKKQGNNFIEHPMCRCQIIIHMPYISKALVKEYIEECNKSPIWRN